MKTCRLDDYVPPGDGEPLDNVQLALVEMWVGIIGRRIRAKLAAEQAAADTTHATETQTVEHANGL